MDGATLLQCRRNQNRLLKGARSCVMPGSSPPARIRGTTATTAPSATGTTVRSIGSGMRPTTGSAPTVYGRWRQSGRHPFAEALAAHLIPALPAPFRTMSPLAIRKKLARALADCDTGAATGTSGQTAGTTNADSRFTLSARRRVRHWVDGLVIGSELFVRDTLRRCRPEAPADTHRLAHATVPDGSTPPALYCWRRLRVMLD